jgi:hypothetical protein
MSGAVMEMIRLGLLFDADIQVTRRAERDEWDRDDTHTSWVVYGLAFSEYGDLHVSGPVQSGDGFHVIYAIYSTGDSFGHDSCGQIEAIMAHRNRDIAEENARRLREPIPQKSNFGEMTVNLLTDEGEEVPYHRPWLGYFESLESLIVEELGVE